LPGDAPFNTTQGGENSDNIDDKKQVNGSTAIERRATDKKTSSARDFTSLSFLHNSQKQKQE
jgi:hypothetical protein